MRFPRLRFNPAYFLMALILLLAGSLAWMWVDEAGQIRNIMWPAPQALVPDIKAAAQTPPNEGAANNSALFAVILERPVFAPDRRPPPPPVPPAPPPPPDPLANIQIHGIFSGNNPGILARVDGAMRRIKLNETIGSWALKNISDRDVTFAQGEDTRSLRLNYAPLGPPAAMPPAGNTANPALTRQPLTPTLNRPNPEDAARENIRIRNEIRASRGLPLITE